MIDTHWIVVAFMIAASALMKVSRLYALHQHLYTKFINWYCVFYAVYPCEFIDLTLSESESVEPK